MKLSAKKKAELYDAVHEEIMQARIKIWKLKDDPKPSIAEIDNILSDLSMSAPKKALEVFTGKPLTECMMGRDCECNHPQCPVTDEDEKNGKYCTLPLYDYRE